VSKYVYELARARKTHKCAGGYWENGRFVRCDREIRPGDLYVRYFEYGMGTHYHVMTDKRCLRCAWIVVEKMLISGRKRIFGRTLSRPDDTKPLRPEEQETLQKALKEARG